jgi:hypothetical protein
MISQDSLILVKIMDINIKTQISINTMEIATEISRRSHTTTSTISSTRATILTTVETATTTNKLQGTKDKIVSSQQHNQV